MRAHSANCLDPSSCYCELKRYALASLIAAIILALELAGGFFTNSLSLLSDAVHVGGDLLALLAAILVFFLVRKKSDNSDLWRAIGSWVLGLLMIGSAIFISWEAIKRFHDHQVSAPLVVLVIAIIGAGGNWVQHKILNADEERSRTERDLDRHFINDFGQSIGVIVSAIIIMTTGWMTADLIISLGIAVWTLNTGRKILMGAKSDDHHHDH
ncbi:MAG: cation diffusion facilitator family transporter [Patescibacteria group bacterium]